MAGKVVVSTLNDDTGVLATQNGMTGIAKAWVSFNGTGTVAIRSSFNVSSITDNGTGDYTVNFTTAMPSAEYAIVSGAVQGEVNTPSFSAPSQTASSFNMQVRSSNGTLSDAAYAYIAIFSS